MPVANMLDGGTANQCFLMWIGNVCHNTLTRDGLQVVCDDGKNEKMVMKNAHEIAILG